MIDVILHKKFFLIFVWNNKTANLAFRRNCSQYECIHTIYLHAHMLLKSALLISSIHPFSYSI